MMTNKPLADKPLAQAAIAPKLRAQLVRERLRLQHDSIRTGQAYPAWIRRSKELHVKCCPYRMVLTVLNGARQRVIRFGR